MQTSSVCCLFSMYILQEVMVWHVSSVFFMSEKSKGKENWLTRDMLKFGQGATVLFKEANYRSSLLLNRRQSSTIP